MLKWQIITPIIYLCYCFFFYDVIAQENPSIGKPKKWDRSTSYRHNFCDIQRFLSNGTIQMEDALRGRVLSIITTDYRDMSGGGDENLFRINKQGELDDKNPGLIAVLLDELAKRAGFEWRNSFSAVTPIDAETDGNKTWTDLLRWEIDTFDVSADYWAKTTERINMGMSFPQGWHDASPILVQSIQPAKKVFDMWSFLRPFETAVWALIVASIISTGLMYFFLEKIEKNSDARNLEDKPLSAIFLSAITFTGHFEFRPNSNAAKLLSFSWTFWALVTASSYTANLASFLVSRQNPNFTFSSLSQAASRNSNMCVRRFSNQDKVLSKVYPPANIIRKDQHEDTFLALRTGECQAAFTTRSTFDIYKRSVTVNKDCSLKWTGYTHSFVSSGFVVAFDSGDLCTSLVSTVLDLHLIRMEADGFTRNAWDAYMDARSGSRRQCSTLEAADNGNDSETSRQLGVKEMGGIFVFHSILCGVAYCLAAYHYIQKRRMIKEHSDEQAAKPEGGGSDDDVFSNNVNGSDIKKRPNRSMRPLWRMATRQSMWDSGYRHDYLGRNIAVKRKDDEMHTGKNPSERILLPTEETIIDSRCHSEPSKRFKSDIEKVQMLSKAGFLLGMSDDNIESKD